MTKEPDSDLIQATLDRLDEQEIAAFIMRHGQVSKNEAEILWMRAQEIGGRHPYLCDLEAAYFELKKQDPSFGEPPAEPKPEPTFVQKLESHGITRVPVNTGAELTVPASERERLRNVPLRELKRMADHDRHAALSETRRKQIKASEI